MKKFFKFILAVGSLAGLAYGALYVYKNYFEKKDAESSEDFEDDDDLDGDNDDTREYVSIDITTEAEDDTAEDKPYEASSFESQEENF